MTVDENSTATRVVVLGYSHEVNSLASVTRLSQGFDARNKPGGLENAWESAAFVRRLSELRRAEFITLPAWEIPPGGPMQHDDFDSFLDSIAVGLRNAGRVDAVAILGHGAGTTTVDSDADGTYMRLVRSIVGPTVPIVAVLDFHANVSAAMLAACDACVGYLTNPHTDIEERLVEMAGILHRLLDGERVCRAWVRLPLIAAQLGLLTAPDEPMGRVIARAMEWRGPEHVNVSVFGGFSLADTADCGMSVVVTAPASESDSASRLAMRIAGLLWSLRGEFRYRTTSVADAVAMCRDERRRLILADVADNPGGGGSGSTVHLLEALHDPDDPISGVQLGVLCDPLVVADAWEHGKGALFKADFNRVSTDPFAQRRSFAAGVVSLNDGWFTPSSGMMAGASLNIGRTCALDIGGIMVGVSEHPFQCTDPDVMRHAGLDPESARVVVLKSRGHFRAGFVSGFEQHEIVEVGAPGLATNDLESVGWRNIPRPVYPLDREFDWSADSCEVFL